MTPLSIAIVGDYNPANRSHIATNDAIQHCAENLNLPVSARWIATEDLAGSGGLELLAVVRGIWIAPASPYHSMEGALLAIRTARERGCPLLGTCGGFQHIILEYARNVLGITDAEHAETAPEASRQVISRLACSLVGRSMTIALEPNSIIARVYGQKTIEGHYWCNFGVNADYVGLLQASTLRIVGSDDEGTVRAVELSGHPFFVGTLFMPQVTSTAAAPDPLVSEFFKTCAQV